MEEKVQTENMVRVGVLMLNSGDSQRAIHFFTDALRSDPMCIGAYLGMICALDTEKGKTYCSVLETFPIIEVRDYLIRNKEMLEQSLPSLIEKAVSSFQSIDLIEAILDLGANLNEQYLLFHALTSKRSNVFELVEALLKYGANPNVEYRLYFRDDNVTETCTPLRDAIWRLRDPNIVSLLIKYGANVNYTISESNGGSCSLIDLAVRSDSPEVVEVLLKNGANSNDGRVTYPVRGGYKYQYTSLGDAICNNVNIDIVKLLLKYGADVNYRMQIEDYSYSAGNRYKYIKSACCSLSDTIMYSSKAEQIVMLLLDNGANPHATYIHQTNGDNDFCIAEVPVLDLAIHKNNLPVIKLLVEAGANFLEMCYLRSSVTGSTHEVRDQFPLKKRSYSYSYRAVEGYKDEYHHLDKDVEDYIRNNGWKGPGLFGGGSAIVWD